MLVFRKLSRDDHPAGRLAIRPDLLVEFNETAHGYCWIRYLQGHEVRSAKVSEGFEEIALMTSNSLKVTAEDDYNGD